MATGITGISTFSGLVESFELASQHDLLTDGQEDDLAEFQVHTGLAKPHNLHGTPDGSRHAAVRFSSDGSREVGPKQKDRVLKLAGKDDDEDADSGEQDSGGVRVVIESTIILGSNGASVVSREEMAALLRAMRAGGLTASLGDFFSPIGSPTVSFPSTEKGRQLQELQMRAQEFDRKVNEQHQGSPNKTHDENLKTALDLMARLQIWLDDAMAGDGIDPYLDSVFKSIVGNLQETVGHVLYHVFGYDFTQPGNFLSGNQDFIGNLRRAWNLLAEEVPFIVGGDKFDVPFALDDLAYHAGLTGESLLAYTRLKRDICELRYVMNWRLRKEGISSGKVADCMDLSAQIFADLQAVSTKSFEERGLAGLAFYYRYSLSHLRGAMTLVPPHLWITHVFASARVYGSLLDIVDVLNNPDWQSRFPERIQRDLEIWRKGMIQNVLYMARRTWISESVARRIKAAVALLQGRHHGRLTFTQTLG